MLFVQYAYIQKQPTENQWAVILYSILFFHGHVPGKNTLIREQLRKAAAKPVRKPELFWPEKPTKCFEGQIA